MRKLITITILAVALCVTGYSQTNAPAPTPAFLSEKIGSIFGLYDPNVDYYTGKTQFGLNTGLSYSTTKGGIEQEIEPNAFYKVGGNSWLGLGVNIDTLGQNESSVDGIGVHGYWKYAKHNIAGIIGIGYQRDIAVDRRAFEVGFGAEGYVSDNVGIFAKYFVGITGTGKDDVWGRLVAGATWKF